MSRRSWLSFAFGALSLIAGTLAIVHQTGGTNPITPAGHEGYLARRPIWLGQGGFVGTQTGPASPGWSWRVYVTNLDMRPQTYSESMHIFSSDNLEVAFDAHALIRLRPGSVRQVVERYSGDAWYANNVQRPYCTRVREIVRQHAAFEIKDLSERLGIQIRDALRQEYRGQPFELIAVSIGNIDYPDSVDERVVANLAAEQRRQRMEVEQRIAHARAHILETRASGEARAQHIEQATLTPLFVQHEAADLYASLADETDDENGVARAHVVVVVPTRADRAGVPRINEGQ